MFVKGDVSYNEYANPTAFDLCRETVTSLMADAYKRGGVAIQDVTWVGPFNDLSNRVRSALFDICTRSLVQMLPLMFAPTSSTAIATRRLFPTSAIKKNVTLISQVMVDAAFESIRRFYPDCKPLRIKSMKITRHDPWGGQSVTLDDSDDGEIVSFPPGWAIVVQGITVIENQRYGWKTITEFKIYCRLRDWCLPLSEYCEVAPNDLVHDE